MSEAAAYLTVLLAAATPWLEVLLVVPAGIVAGLPPLPVTVVAALGNLATLVPLVLGGERIRRWWRRRRATRPAVAAGPDGTAPEPSAHGDGSDQEDDGTLPRQGRSRRAARLFDRYGLPGLAALGPLLTGVHVAAVVALAAGAERRRTLAWLSTGVVVWAVIAAVAAVVGIDTLWDRDQLPDLGLR